jgi:uncharacterized membrane protein (UPF0182 family)
MAKEIKINRRLYWRGFSTVKNLKILDIFKLILIAIGVWYALDLVINITVDFLWFEEVNYLIIFQKRLITQGILWAIALIVSGSFLGINLALANRFKYPKNFDFLKPDESRETMLMPPVTMPYSSKPVVPALGLGLLSLFILGLILLVSVILIHYILAALNYWHTDLTLPKVSPQMPVELGLESTVQLFTQIPSNLWELGVVIVVAIGVMVNASFFLRAIAIFLSIIFGLILSSHWSNILEFIYATPFNITEEVFNLDASFYVFILPVLQLLEFWLVGLFLYALASCTLLYFLSGNSLVQGSFLSFSQPQQRHLHGLAGGLMLTIAYSYFIDCFELLYSPRGVAYGAGFTDVKIQLPVNIFLAVLAVFIAGFLFWQTIFSVQPIQPYIELSLRLLGWRRRKRRKKKQIAKLFANSYSLRAILTWYLIVAALGGLLLPEIVQQVIVEPNEIEREIPYIKRSINFTRQAFNLDKIETKFFNPENQLTYQDIQDNKLTIENIRLWDTRPILATNKQLQQIRPYYEFHDADIDRYTILKEASDRNQKRATEKEQVIISARELNYQAVSEAAQTWVNKYLVYTHGYGFTLSPVSKVGAGGLPEYFVKNIGPSPALDSNTTLEVSARIRYSIPIGKPRIYYGELTDNEVMISTKEENKELDYPSGDTNVYNTYRGRGGILLSNGWRRLLFAKYLKNWRMIFTRDFTTDTKVLFRRDIAKRVRSIAPFLRYDRDPYLVVANPNFNNILADNETPNYLYWILDAYTTSDRFPYSDPENHDFNYIRNSVKVVIDAYNGSVNFYYIDDSQDPIINTWRRVFPEMFTPLKEMPASLRSHIRYPVDLFSVQSERLAIYHMENPLVFYNREDVWRVPLEIYGVQEQPVEPYYLIMKLPEEQSEEFILLLPFTPVSRNNLIAWLAARSDGENYGKLLLYQFPKQRLVYGPEQIEALLNQDPEISQQISLWNRQGSRAVQGNLLVIPIEQSLLYVEPIYLEADRNSLPTLVRVVVAYENRIVMKETLSEALREVFEVEPTPTTPLVVPPTEDVS